MTTPNTPNPREQKGLEIAARKKIKKQADGKWIVPSQSGKGTYQVQLDPVNPKCNCPDHEVRQVTCKHIFAAQYVVQRETTEETIITRRGARKIIKTTETKTVRMTYSQVWPAYNEAQTKEKALFQSLLHSLCATIPEPVYKAGRPPLAIADKIFSIAFKIYSTVSGRRFATDLQEAHAKGYLSQLPCYNSVFNYLEAENLTPILKSLIEQSSLPLQALESDFAVDSSGFSTYQFVSWFSAKHGQIEDNHDWIKLHIATGVKTNVVTAVEVTDRDGADCPRLPALIETTGQQFNIKEVSADKAYSSVRNHDVIAKVGGQPYIAFKANTTGAVGGLFQQMWHFYSYNRDEFLTHYHKRSNSESTFSMIKAKFGARIRSKTPTAQINEALCKVLCHNVCCVIQSMFEFGIEPNFGGTPLK
jgi:transposase